MSRKQDRELVRRALGQHGQLSRSDAAAVLERDDAFEHLIRSRLWKEALPGVLVPAATVVTREVREHAVFRWDSAAILSHYSAARRSGIWVPDHDDAWALVPYESSKRSLPGLQVRRTRVWPDQFLHRDGEYWTKPERTLVDLSALLTRNQLEAVLMSAIRVKKTTAADVAELAASMSKRRGLTQLLEVTGLWDPKRESMLEEQLFGDVVAVSPFEVVRQHEVRGPDGEKALADVAIPELKLAFEGDGLFFHSSEAQILFDQGRDRWMAVVGWLTHRYREAVMADRLGVRRQIRGLIEARARELGIPFAA